jgi:hypothetical protein
MIIMPTWSGCLEPKFTRRSPLCPPEARVVWAAVMPMPQTSSFSNRTSQQWRTANYMSEKIGRMGGVGEWPSDRRARWADLSPHTFYVLTWQTQPPLAKLIYNCCACGALCRVKRFEEHIRLCYATFQTIVCGCLILSGKIQYLANIGTLGREVLQVLPVSFSWYALLHCESINASVQSTFMPTRHRALLVNMGNRLPDFQRA